MWRTKWPTGVLRTRLFVSSRLRVQMDSITILVGHEFGWFKGSYLGVAGVNFGGSRL